LRDPSGVTITPGASISKGLRGRGGDIENGHIKRSLLARVQQPPPLAAQEANRQEL